MSFTLTRILDHWIGELPYTPDLLDPKVFPGTSVALPFNIEEFCRQNDAYIENLAKQIGECNSALDRAIKVTNKLLEGKHARQKVQVKSSRSLLQRKSKQGRRQKSSRRP